ncbi:MAG: dihydroorotase [Gammaproteobacteria bacterium]|jgi:dihydroorotase
MTEMTLITNARMVNEGLILDGDLLIKGGRIEQVGAEIKCPDNCRVMDAKGRLLMPGMIDDQVHFREPGASNKGDIYSESRAAVAGGITSYMDMPNTNPNTVTLEALESKYAIAAKNSAANYAFYLGATNDNIDVIRSLDPKQACGIKVFMGASTGNMLVDREESLEKIFRDAPVLVATHCEDSPTIKRNEDEMRAKYGDDIPISMHPLIRSEEACYLSSSLAVELAKRHGTRLHVLHLTTAREMGLFEDKPLDEKRITAEVCVHHLFFSDKDYALKGAFIKCNPAIKKSSDRDALRQALKEGRIDIVATDHAPHLLEEKLGNYFQAPSGLPLVQHALPMLLELCRDEYLSLEMLVEKTSHAPARLFAIEDRGYLREGYWADLVLVDYDHAFRVERDDVLYKCGWSPLEGMRLRSSIAATFVNGQLAYHHGNVMDQLHGARLSFNR